MAIILENALLTDIDPPRLEAGELRIDAGRITGRAAHVEQRMGDETVDCDGCVVLPGLVNGHTHLYSALAVGMPPPPQTPSNFLEILKFIWWRLDQALDAESVEMSARIGALEALRCGTTTIFDHHASPNCIAGSLDLIQKGIADVGLRGVLCYETTDRHGREGREAGLAENHRFLEKCANRRDGQFTGLVGAHASLTLEEETLDEIAGLAGEFETGVHMHVAEDLCDEEDCQSRFQMLLIDHLAAHRLLKPQSVFAHGTHLDAEAVARVTEAGVMLAHNPRSNMNNAVGYAAFVSSRPPPMLGTDGIGGDMFAEAKAAWLIARHEHAAMTPNTVLSMLAMSARHASDLLGVTLGKLEVGAAADVVVTDYRPFTPLRADNVPGHFLHALSANHVQGVIVDGQWRLRDRVVVGRNEAEDRGHARQVTMALWNRLGCGG